MVLDSLQNSELYCALHPKFNQAFSFVKEKIENLEVGKYEIDGDNIYVMIVDADLKKPQDAKLEAHKKYIDIQIVISGSEIFGWSELPDCKSPNGDFDNEKDIIFFSDKPTTMVTVEKGQFIIFFPEDGHAPLIGEGKVRKAIIKVKVR